MPVLDEIAAERRRQIDVEGWTPGHDDEYQPGILSRAAAAYAIAWTGVNAERLAEQELWPFASRWWKPKDQRRDLLRAAALLVAEIEKIDRAALAASD